MGFVMGTSSLSQSPSLQSPSPSSSSSSSSSSFSSVCFFQPLFFYSCQKRNAQINQGIRRTIMASCKESTDMPFDDLAEILGEDDLVLSFFEDRKLNGDLIAKVSDLIWMREVKKFVNTDTCVPVDATRLHENPLDDEDEGGFLKLTRKNKWLLGENLAPVNKKIIPKEMQNDSKRRTRLNILQYEALKRELLLLTVSIGAACSGYCWITLSMQAAVSYATGVLFSCLYLQLLYQHADKLSRETVPQIFMRKKLKKIGIQSQDLEDFFERLVKGSSIALSSPRLVIPAGIYGLWGISQHFASTIVDFQLVPAMVGVFAYKAACLVQVYRDNEDLQLIFPETGGESSD